MIISWFTIRIVCLPIRITTKSYDNDDAYKYHNEDVSAYNNDDDDDDDDAYDDNDD